MVDAVTRAAHVGDMETTPLTYADVNLDELEGLCDGATRGPWAWTSHRVPDLVGVTGERGVYEWETEVIEATHNGECGCRSACELELNIKAEDAEYIARTSPDVVRVLIQRIRDLEAGAVPRT